MRLINCRSDPLRIEEFIGRPPHSFAVLSHTWDQEEVTFQDFANTDTRTLAKGWEKIYKTCLSAREWGHDYVWVDCCCIDKTNNAELTESINSMFQWYNDAAVCLVYLSDFDAVTGDLSTLRNARWFSRGWTLQETIAPREAYFYDRSWRFFGTRATLYEELSSITGIDAIVLSPPDGVEIRDLLDEIPVARRMSWAASRQTTKLEDIAYCLIGIFGVNMPMLYGEGLQAFVRLQEEIIRDNNDLTLFAWTAKGDIQSSSNSTEQPRSTTTYRGILARSPAEFAGLGNLVLDHDIKFNPDFSMSNKGLRIHTPLHPTRGTEDVVMPLHCYAVGDNGVKMPQLGIFLKHEGASVYVRTRPHHLANMTDQTPTSGSNNIFISKRVRTKIAQMETNDASAPATPSLCAVYFNFQGKAFQSSAVRLLETAPHELWDAENRVFITKGLRSFTAFHRFQVVGSITGQVVVACGFTEAGKAWLYIDDETGPLFPSALAKDYRTIAEFGTRRGNLQTRKQNLLAPLALSSIQKM
ncbi:hypothetical protein DL765_001233 [Monosporascus sp. GIB2]|nr:hypothetical protein DL765_001233 [Monosporascus sp. GIB2]